MVSCVSAQSGVRKVALAVLGLCLIQFHDAHAVDVSDPLTGKAIAPEWTVHLSPKSAGSIKPEAEGLVLTAEPRSHALVKRKNDAPGTDANPLCVSVKVRLQPGIEGPLLPGLFLYWDNTNYLFIKATHENHIYFGGTAAGVAHDGIQGEVMREVRGPENKPHEREAWFRILLTSRNAAFFVSANGATWSQISEFGRRPGAEGKAPDILLGRAFSGDKDGNPDLSNDFFPDGNKRLISAVFTNFALTDAIPALPDAPALVKQENWEQTCASLEASGIPREWTLLGPAGENLGGAKKDLPPDLTDDWNTPLKDPSGQQVKLFNWRRAEDDTTDCYVDLADHMGNVSRGYGWARTEINWPVDGSALVWMDHVEPLTLFVNNVAVYSDTPDHNSPRAIKDRRCVSVPMKKGRNVIKVRNQKMRPSDWGFYLRLERNDPGYRIRLLEKLLDLFKDQLHYWRAYQARLEIARCYTLMNNYAEALAAYDKAIAFFVNDDEYRLQAFEAKINLLEFLRDYSALLKSSAEYLAAHRQGQGAERAMCESVRAALLSGHPDEAREKMASWSQTPSVTLLLLRTLAGGFEDAGDIQSSLNTLDEIASNKQLSASDRARAAVESAVGRWEQESVKRGSGKQMDAARVALGCKSAQTALALLPGGQSPVIKQFSEEADADMKAQKADRAVAGYWGAILLALCDSNKDASYYLGLNGSHKLTVPAKDSEGHDITDPNRLKDVLSKSIGAQLGDPAWVGKWNFINFDIEQEDHTAFGPETNFDLKATFEKNKKWQELNFDPNRGETNHDLGIDLGQWAGGNTRQIAYLAHDFEVQNDEPAILQMSASASWYGWVDGKPIGENTAVDSFKLERDRVRLPGLAKGRHRLLLKLEAPTKPPFVFRARLSSEPQIAEQLLIEALVLRQFPTSAWDRRGALEAIRNYCQGKTNPQTVIALTDANTQLFSHLKDAHAWSLVWMADRLKESNELPQANQILWEVLKRMQSEGRSLRLNAGIYEIAKKLFLGLVAEGKTGPADNMLRDVCNRYATPTDQYFFAQAMRASLRRDLGQSQSALPFFEYVVREYPPAWKMLPNATQGLEWSRNFRPERMVFETSHEAQSALDAVRRQLDVGTPEDIERAIRNVSEILQNSPNTLSRIWESPYSSRYIGLREYIRSLLSSLPEATREVYRKVVAEASNEHLKKAAAQNDLTALETVAREFYFTAAAASARNISANLYYDRGQYAQAANLFQIMLGEPRIEGSPAPTMVAAKLACALTLDGQFSAATHAIEQLRTRYGETPVRFAGQSLTPGAVADRLGAMLQKHSAVKTQSAVATGAAPSATHMGNLCRTGHTNGAAPEPGGVVWARSLIPSNAQESPPPAFGQDPYNHPQSYPVSADGRVFVSTLGSIRAMDLNTSKTLWTHAWGSGGPLIRTAFNGYPVSCPTVSGSNVYMRAIETRSALRCFDAVTGKLKWSTDTIPAMKSMIWLSDPAVAYGMAYAVFLEQGDMNSHGIAAVDAATGDLRWKTMLVTGNTGVKVSDILLFSTLHSGPPAVDAGEVYLATGLASAAAVNAFSGEVRWTTSYPSINFGDINSGRAYASDLRVRTIKTFSTGPLSPMVTDELVVLAPKDGCGVMAFNRFSGELLWHKDLVDCRYLCGLVDGNVIVCDDTITALHTATGTVRWQHSLGDQRLNGQPTLTGGALYIPTDTELRRLDAHTGRLIGSAEWDSRTGPLSNLLVTPDRIIGVGEDVIAAMGPRGAPTVPLPLYEAREFEASGKLEKAAEQYANIIAESDPDEAMSALSARIRILQKLNKRDEALSTLVQFEQSAPDYLSSPSGLWHIHKKVLMDTLRRQLGVAVEEPAPPSDNLAGVLGYAWQLPGENPHLINAVEGPKDRIYAQMGTDLYCIRNGESCDTLWHSYIGPAISDISVGKDVIAALNDQSVTIIDRASGEPLRGIKLPKQGPVRKKHFQAERFAQVAAGEKIVVAAAGRQLGAWDYQNGKDVWWRDIGESTTIPHGLLIVNEKVLMVYVNHGELFLGVYDAANGNTLQNISLAKGFDSISIYFSPDHKLLVYRANLGFGAIDLMEFKKLWQINANALQVRNHRECELQIEEGMIRLAGISKRNGQWCAQWFETATGKEVFPTQSCWYTRKGTGNEYAGFYDDLGRTICRQHMNNGSLETVWCRTFNGVEIDNHFLQRAIVAGDRLQIFYLRRRENRDQFVLRTLSWDTGFSMGDQVLPGTPIRGDRDNFDIGIFERGGALLYSAREGLFAFRPYGDTQAHAAEYLRKEIGAGNLQPARARDVRRALLTLEPSNKVSLVAPSALHIDGDLAEWQNNDPAVLDSPVNYAPLADSGGWNGPDDLSARVYTGWNQDGLAVAIDVTDDVLVSPQPGRELNTGDSVRVIVSSHAEAGSVLDRNENVVVAMASVNGRSVVNLEFGGSDEPGYMPQGHVVLAPNGKGYRYEMLIPWPLIRKDPSRRPGDQLDLRLGVAIYDDDGAGVKGAMELGAGITTASYVPMWLTQLTLLDVSSEKIQRYRKTIELVPGSDEALRFLELILASKLGPKADEEKIAEIQGFVKAHPNCENTLRAAGLLRPVLQQMGEADPKGRIVKMLQESGVAPALLQTALGTAFKIWIMPDAKKPPSMAMLQFTSNGDWNSASRVYWGVSCVDWGRPNSRQRMNMGPMPKPGEWTELSVSPWDLGLDNREIRSIALTTYGGLTYFDNMRISMAGKETVLIDDVLPPKTKVEFNGLKFVDNPHHDGNKAWTSEIKNPSDNLHNSNISFEDGKPLFSFASPSTTPPPPQDPEKLRDLYRKVAGLIPDTPEGLTFLRRTFDTIGGDDKTRIPKCIDEVKQFLKSNPSNTNAFESLRILQSLYISSGEKNPVARCEEVMQEHKMAREVRRAYFREFGGAWTEWNVLGAFAATGDRRGMETVMEPEKAVNLAWKTVAGDHEVGWSKISNKLDKDKKPNNDPFVDLRRHLNTRKLDQKGPVFAYAFTKFTVPGKRRALMLYGAQDVISIWVNGKRVVNELETRPEKDKEVCEVQLRGGENEILIKVGTQRDQRLGFVFRLADLDGKPFPDVSNE